MKKHNLLKVVLISIVVAALCTWVFSITTIQYDQTTGAATLLADGTRAEVGLFDLFTYPSQAIYYFSPIFVFVLAVGAFYGIISKTGAYRSLLDKLVKGFKGREWIFLVFSMILIAGLTSISGLNFAMLFLFPLVIAVVLLMGYNKLVAASVTVGSLLVGMMGTTYGVENIGGFLDNLGVAPETEITTKLLILVVGLVLLIFHVLYYGNKTRNTTDLAEKEYVPSEVEKPKSVWPLAIFFDVALIVMVMAYIPWESVFGVTAFTDATNWLTEFQISGYPILYKILGAIMPFGQWTSLSQTPFYTLGAVLLISAGIIALCYRMKLDDFLQGLKDGLKKAVRPAGLMLLIYTVLLIFAFHPVQLTIYKMIIELSSGFNIVTVGLVSIISSLFNVDTFYVAQSTLCYLNVSYKEWLKHIWQVVAALLVVLFVIFTIILIV